MANAVYITPLKKGSEKFQFPTLPRSDGGLKVDGSAGYQDFDILNRGEYSFPVGPKSTEIVVAGTFFGEDRQGSELIDHWESPTTCINKLEGWKDEGTHLNFKATGFGIDKDVTIKQFNYLPVGGHGDYEYTLTLKEYKDISITKKKRNSKKKSKSYTVPKNCSSRSSGLAKIAKKYYKKTSAWRKIYNKNKSVIEKAAKKHGRKSSDQGKYLYKGTKLVIP